MATTFKKPLYQMISGVRIPSMFSPTLFKEALAYKAKLDDVFIVTYPKSGTTWMQNTALYIFRCGQPLDNPNDFSVAAPFLDLLGEEGVKLMPRPGTIKTHLPYTHMPYLPTAKYIFVARDPKDVCVSLYHHTSMLPGYGFSLGKFDDFFELFMAGEVEYNDYFDHLLSWFPHRQDQNVFYTTYEDMKRDVKSVILKLGYFLGDKYGKMLDMDNSVMNNVVKLSSFQYMKENISDTFDSYKQKDSILNDPHSLKGLKYLVNFTCSLDIPEIRPPMSFVRKGIVGDWKNHLSSEQEQRLNQKFDETNLKSGIKSLWAI